MGSYGHIPEPDEVPDGMVHVGYRCTAPGHDCLIAISETQPTVDTDGDPDGLALGPNHHASWVAVYARATELGDEGEEDE